MVLVAREFLMMVALVKGQMRRGTGPEVREVEWRHEGRLVATCRLTAGMVDGQRVVTAVFESEHPGVVRKLERSVEREPRRLTLEMMQEAFDQIESRKLEPWQLRIVKLVERGKKLILHPWPRGWMR